MALPIGGKDAVVRDEAATWFERMRGPDAQRFRVDFERWRNGDTDRRDAYARAEENWALAGGLRATTMGATRAGLTPKRRWSISLPEPRYAFAGAALAIVLIVGSFYALRGAAPQAPMIAAARSPASTAVGQIRRERLEDGSTVILDTDSEVEIAYTKSIRVVRLIRGRARFEVAHDAGRPFIVEAAGRTVTARGTIFDVCAYGSAMRVSLLRGAIDVGYGTALRPAAGLVTHLRVGQSLRSALGGVAAEVRPAPRGEDQWVAGMLTFDGTPLSDVIDQTNRYSKAKIRLADPVLNGLKVTGAFRPLPIEELAAGLAAAFSLRVEAASNGDFILHPR